MSNEAPSTGQPNSISQYSNNSQDVQGGSPSQDSDDSDLAEPQVLLNVREMYLRDPEQLCEMLMSLVERKKQEAAACGQQPREIRALLEAKIKNFSSIIANELVRASPQDAPASLTDVQLMVPDHPVWGRLYAAVCGSSEGTAQDDGAAEVTGPATSAHELASPDLSLTTPIGMQNCFILVLISAGPSSLDVLTKLPPAALTHAVSSSGCHGYTMTAELRRSGNGATNPRASGHGTLSSHTFWNDTAMTQGSPIQGVPSYAIIQQYLSRLPDNAPRLLLEPLANPSDEVWYSDQPLEQGELVRRVKALNSAVKGSGRGPHPVADSFQTPPPVEEGLHELTEAGTTPEVQELALVCLPLTTVQGILNGTTAFPFEQLGIDLGGSGHILLQAVPEFTGHLPEGCVAFRVSKTQEPIQQSSTNSKVLVTPVHALGPNTTTLAAPPTLNPDPSIATQPGSIGGATAAATAVPSPAAAAAAAREPQPAPIQRTSSNASGIQSDATWSVDGGGPTDPGGRQQQMPATGTTSRHVPLDNSKARATAQAPIPDHGGSAEDYATRGTGAEFSTELTKSLLDQVLTLLPSLATTAEHLSKTRDATAAAGELRALRGAMDSLEVDVQSQVSQVRQITDKTTATPMVPVTLVLQLMLVVLHLIKTRLSVLTEMVAEVADNGGEQPGASSRQPRQSQMSSMHGGTPQPANQPTAFRPHGQQQLTSEPASVANPPGNATSKLIPRLIPSVMAAMMQGSQKHIHVDDVVGDVAAALQHAAANRNKHGGGVGQDAGADGAQAPQPTTASEGGASGELPQGHHNRASTTARVGDKPPGAQTNMAGGHARLSADMQELRSLNRSISVDDDAVQGLVMLASSVTGQQQQQQQQLLQHQVGRTTGAEPSSSAHGDGQGSKRQSGGGESADDMMNGRKRAKIEGLMPGHARGQAGAGADRVRDMEGAGEHPMQRSFVHLNTIGYTWEQRGSGGGGGGTGTGANDTTLEHRNSNDLPTGQQNTIVQGGRRLLGGEQLNHSGRGGPDAGGPKGQRSSSSPSLVDLTGPDPPPPRMLKASILAQLASMSDQKSGSPVKASGGAMGALSRGMLGGLGNGSLGHAAGPGKMVMSNRQAVQLAGGVQDSGHGAGMAGMTGAGHLSMASMAHATSGPMSVLYSTSNLAGGGPGQVSYALVSPDSMGQGGGMVPIAMPYSYVMTGSAGNQQLAGIQLATAGNQQIGGIQLAAAGNQQLGGIQLTSGPVGSGREGAQMVTVPLSALNMGLGGRQVVIAQHGSVRDANSQPVYYRFN